MKKKIVVKVAMNDDKSRSKALKIAVGILRVESVALAGADKDQVVVVGEDIDAVALTRQLRKKLGFTELVSVGEDKKETPATANAAAAPPPPMVVWSYPPQYTIHEVTSHDQSCNIM